MEAKPDAEIKFRKRSSFLDAETNFKKRAVNLDDDKKKKMVQENGELSIC